jgi:hypothetical protein
MLDIEKLTMGKDVSYKQVEKITKEEGMTDEKVAQIASYDGNAEELSTQDLEAYENGLVVFDTEEETPPTTQSTEEEQEETEEKLIKNEEKVKYDEEEKKYYINVESEVNNCLSRIIRKQYGVEVTTDEGKEIMEQIIEMNPQIYDSGRKGTSDIMGVENSGAYIHVGERMYLPNGSTVADETPAITTENEQTDEVPLTSEEAPLADEEVPQDEEFQWDTPPEEVTSSEAPTEEPGVEIPENIQDLVEEIEETLDPDTNWSIDATKVEELVDSASAEQMYALNNYWNEAKGVGFSEQIQKSLSVKEDDEIITTIETKIQQGKTAAEEKAQAEIQKAYSSMPSSVQDAADTLSAMLIDGSKELNAQEVYGTVLKLYNDNTSELDEYWQKAYGTTLSESIGARLDGQDAVDIAMVIDARINNPTYSRNKEQMTELKTNLENILTNEPVDRNALSTLLIGENVSTQAMAALDKYCRENLGTSLAAAVYSNCDAEDSNVLIGWLENYKITPSTSQEAEETGEALAEALSKSGDTWGVNKDSVYEILGSYTNMNQESLLNLFAG